MGGTRSSMASTRSPATSLSTEALRLYRDLGGNPFHRIDRESIGVEGAKDIFGRRGYAKGDNVHLNDQVTRDVERFLRGDRDDKAIDAYRTLVHEVTHLTGHSTLPGDAPYQWMTEGLTSIRSEEYMKARFPELADQIRPAYPNHQAALKAMAPFGGENFLERMWREADPKNRQRMASKASRGYLKSILVSRGATSFDAEDIVKKVGKPYLLYRYFDDLQKTKSVTHVAQHLANYRDYESRGIDYRKYR